MANTQRSPLWTSLSVIGSILIVAASAAASYELVRRLRTEPGVAKQSDTDPRVKTAPVQAHHDGMPITADGLVVPFREIDLAAEVAGRITERTEICRQGNYVEAGTPLIKIDRRDYELEEERLEKELQQASVALDELAEEINGLDELIELAEKEVTLRVREMKRQQHLAGVVTSTDLERAESSELVARNALITIRNRLRLLKTGKGRLEGARDLISSKLKKSRLDLERTTIVAPVSGVIVAENIEEDSYVQKGTTLLTLEDTSKVEVKCKLKMEELYWLWDQRSPSADRQVGRRPGDAYAIPETNVKVVYRLGGREDLEYVWAGRLSRYDGIGLDAKTRTVPCRVVVDDPQKRVDEPSISRPGPPALVRGMYVSIRIQLDPKTRLLRIPEEAVQLGEVEGNVVWRVRSGKLSIEPVNFVTAIDSVDGPDATGRDALVYVANPDRLTVKDQVVISPMASVRSGMDVEISDAE